MDDLNSVTISQALQAKEAKRARQREHVKRSYYRLQNKMKALRQDVHDLEEEYARTIQLKQQQQQWREVAEALSGDEDREPSSDLVEQYMQLSIKKEQLQRENQELALIAAQHATFQLKAQHLLEAEDLPMASPSWLMGLSALGFDPMTVAECHRIGIEAYQQIRAFLESNSYLTTACELFGWSERRREAPDHVKFTLKKHFTGTTPMDMSARAWRVVSSPRGLAGLYSSTMHLSLKVLQVVDDHNVVMYRVIRGARSTRAVQSLFLVSRFHVESGYIILFRSVDRSRLQKLGGDEEAEDKWLDMFTWTLFENDPENVNAVRFSYGGIVFSTEAVGTHVWMLEILMLAMNWENKVVGPPVLLCN